MKILYISQYYPPEMCAPAARVSELARYWARIGHQVTVLTGFPNHPTGKIHPEYKDKFKNLIVKERYHGVNVVRTWLLPFPNRKPHERIINYASFWLSASLSGIFFDKPDVIIATSPQLLVGLVGFWLGKLKCTPFVFEVRDLWPDSIVASDIGEKAGLMIRTLRKISGFLYRSSHHIIVVTPAFKNELINNWSISEKKISIVENGVDTSLFKPNGKSEKVKYSFGLNQKFVLSYIGTHGYAHGLDTMIKAAEKVLESYPDIAFLLVGDGADKERLISEAKKKNLTNVFFVDSQRREKIPGIIEASDVSVVLLKKRKIFETVIPTKMLESFACGKAVILGVNGQARQVLEAAHAGIYIPPEDSDALVDALRNLYEDGNFRNKLGKNGRRYIDKYLSRENTAEHYIQVLTDLIKDPSL